jgi:hypothetical protein
LRETSGLDNPPLDPAGKVALREIEEVVQTTALGQRTIHFILASDVRKHLRHRDHSKRLFFLNAKCRTHHFQEFLELAEKQVILVAEVKIKRGTTDRCSVQHFLHRYVIDGFLLNQRHQCSPKPLVRAPDALIGFARLHSSMFALPRMFLQLGAPVPGHRQPLCSTTQNDPRLHGIEPLDFPFIRQRRNLMNRLRLLAVGTILMFALTTVAQQATPSASVPAAEGQLKFLAAKLDLTSGQQEKIKPILQELHDATVKLVHDENMSREERLDKVKDSRFAADKKIRAILNDDQKQKLDELEHEPHPELHGDLGGPKN